MKSFIGARVEDKSEVALDMSHIDKGNLYATYGHVMELTISKWRMSGPPKNYVA